MSWIGSALGGMGNTVAGIVNVMKGEEDQRMANMQAESARIQAIQVQMQAEAQRSYAQAARAQADMESYNADVERKTGEAKEKLLIQQANAESTKTAYEEMQQREQARKILSAQTALYGASGVDSSTGSPLTVIAKTAATNERTAQVIRYGGELSETALRDQGVLEKWAGNQKYELGMAKSRAYLSASKSYDWAGAQLDKLAPTYIWMAQQYKEYGEDAAVMGGLSGMATMLGGAGSGAGSYSK